MRKAAIYNNGVFAGVLTEEDPVKGKGYVFKYDDSYFTDRTKSSISLTLPKTQQEYRSEKIFPFFSNMIAEGFNLGIQSNYHKIDEKDVMGILLATGATDTIGSITIKKFDDK
jgi:HipA-like protein